MKLLFAQIGVEKQRRMRQDWFDALKEVTANNIDNIEKLHWLLSKLELDTETREELISSLQ